LSEPPQAGERRHPHDRDERVVDFDRRHHGSASRRAKHSWHGAAAKFGRRTTGPTAWTTTGRRAVESRTALTAATATIAGAAVRRTAAAAAEGSGEAHAAGNFGTFGSDRCAVRKNDRGRPMQFLHAPFGIRAQIEFWITLKRALEFVGDELREIAAHALGHAALGLAGDPDEERDLQPEHQREEENESESDAPVERSRLKHLRTYTRCPRPS